MRLNGLYIVAELAIRELNEPLIDCYRDALVLGSLREDVWYVPGARIVFEHLSFSHFYKPGKPGGIVPYLWPGPRFKANKFYDRAVSAFRQGERASAFVSLGRVAHLLTCAVLCMRTVRFMKPIPTSGGWRVTSKSYSLWRFLASMMRTGRPNSSSAWRAIPKRSRPTKPTTHLGA
jgi:hypothetical protein